MNRLRTLLANLENDGATGRVSIKGVLPAVIHLDRGLVAGAERRDQPALLVAMGEAGLFSPDEWQLALRLPTREKWRALVDDDEERLDALARFARAYTSEVLRSLVAADLAPGVFTPNVGHPFGPLASWPLDELLGDEPEPTVTHDVLPADEFDRREFLELLLEVSPLVRPLET